MDPRMLTVYKSPFPKKRIGRPYDGGYVIVDIPDAKYDVILSGGISDDISFEEEFLNYYSNCFCYAHDGTIDNISTTNERIIFVKKNIGNVNNDELTNLHEIINSHSKIFVKMDIEGGEVDWIKSLKNSQLSRFEQIVIEFHVPFTYREIEMFKKINQNHYLVHFHPNNTVGVLEHEGVIIPLVFECTYLHKKFFSTPPELNTDKIPGIMDMKNTDSKEDIFIDYPPFVNK